MYRALLLAMIVLTVFAQSAATAADDDVSTTSLAQRYATGVVGVGDWLVQFSGVQWAVTDGAVTGLAFGPGRSELAYTTTGSSLGSALWLLSVPPFEEEGHWLQGPIESPARLLFRAPEGQTLRGSLWWAPNASSLALLSRREDTADLLSVDYVSGAAATLAQDVNVVELAWEPGARRLAYATEADGLREVWLQTLPPGEPRRIGEGGFNLRWSLDGALTWLRPDSETTLCEVRWDPQSEQTSTAGSFPARSPAALWSPDGLLCADLAPAEDPHRKELVVYPTASRVGDRLPLTGTRAERLLGWSPDSRLVVLLVAGDSLLAAGARPAGSQLARILLAEGVGTTIAQELAARASLVGYPIIDPRSGLPAWSSAGDRLAYVVAPEDVYRRRFERIGTAPYGRLVIQSLTRRYVQPGPLTDNTEAQEVLSNVKNVALALQMYLADNSDVFPPVGDSETLLPILGPYFRTSDIFMRPGTEDDLVVRYVVAPGTRFADLPDTARTPVVIVDYSPDFLVIGFGDGHAMTFDRTLDNDAMLADWWAEFDALRAEDPNALPPPFPPKN